MSAVLGKRRIVADLSSTYSGKKGEAVFSYSEEPDDPYAPDVETTVRLPYADWIELGWPIKITLTIEPGDKLNGGTT